VLRVRRSRRTSHPVSMLALVRVVMGRWTALELRFGIEWIIKLPKICVVGSPRRFEICLIAKRW
jgi:hypothetical protein